jgi:hypothetical protein
MKMTSRTIALTVVVVILGGILLAMAFGVWITESTKQAAKITTGEYAGISNPADIRGSYSFADVEKNFNISADLLAQAFAVDLSVKAAGAYLAKDLEAIYTNVADGAGEVGTDSVKWFVALYLGIPYTPEESTYLPNPALQILKDGAKVTDEVFQELKLRSISPSTVISAEVQAEHVESSTDRTIKGLTTFADLLSWGMTQAEIEKAIGGAMPDRAIKLRDYFVEKNMEYSTYRTTLQEIIDKL